MVTKSILSCRFRGSRTSRSWALTRAPTKISRKGGLENLACPGYVAGDGAGIRDHLALEARVELHVADLIDELAGEEAAFLLVVLSQDQPAELSQDPFLGNHQRGQSQEQKGALGLGDGRPVPDVLAEVDVVRRPVGVLPVHVHLLRRWQGGWRRHLRRERGQCHREQSRTLGARARRSAKLPG